jgi:hypothetical protein
MCDVAGLGLLPGKRTGNSLPRSVEQCRGVRNDLGSEYPVRRLRRLQRGLGVEYR